MKKKFAVAAATAALITASLSFTAFAASSTDPGNTTGNEYEQSNNGGGWSDVTGPSGKKQYLTDKDDPSSAIKGTFAKIAGKTYYFDSNGYTVSGEYQVGGKTFLFDANGVLLTGFQTVDGKTFYYAEKALTSIDAPSSGTDLILGEKYAPASDKEAEINGKKYVFVKDGQLVKGWLKTSDGKWHYANADGTDFAVVDSKNDGKWTYTGGKAYWIDGATNIMKAAASGVESIQTQENSTTSTWYVDTEGHWIGGWYLKSAKNTNGTVTYTWEWYDPSGAGKATSWVKSGNDWYYVSANTMVADKVQADTDGTKYAFDKSGKMIVGWGTVTVGGNKKTVYAKSNGVLVTAPTEIDGVKYQFESEGCLAANTIGATIFDKSGKVITNGWFLMDKDTDVSSNTKLNALKTSDVNKIAGKYVYIKDGAVVVGSSSATIKYAEVKWNNGIYYVDSNGVLVTSQVLNLRDNSVSDFSTATALQISDWARDCVLVDKNGGVIKNGWVNFGDGNWGYAENFAPKNGWVFSGGKYYYINYGVMLKDTITPDGYIVDANGVWVE